MFSKALFHGVVKTLSCVIKGLLGTSTFYPPHPPNNEVCVCGGGGVYTGIGMTVFHLTSIRLTVCRCKFVFQNAPTVLRYRAETWTHVPVYVYEGVHGQFL